MTSKTYWESLDEAHDRFVAHHVNKGMVFEVRSDIYKAGVTEDGDGYTAEVYFVAVRDEAGNQWAYPEEFPGCHVSHNEDSICFEDVRETAKNSARVLRDLLQAKPIDISKWTPIAPAFGSEAYQKAIAGRSIPRMKI